MKNHNKNKKSFLPYYILAAILVLAILIILSVQYGIFSATKGNIREVTIKDECSLIMGNLIHEIGSESNCKLACETECTFIKEKVYNYSFSQSLKDSSCNSCLCNCQG